MIGDKDTIVDNQKTQEWHDKTKSAVKEFKRIPLMYHELSKEPNAQNFLLAVLKFCEARITASAPAFGDYDASKVNIAKQVAKGAATTGGKKKRMRLILILYFLIGLILAILKHRKRLFLIWPLMPFLKH